ncbi:MAG: hypothetical protein ACRDYA_02800 [Egibacteraceae bacterium]
MNTKPFVSRALHALFALGLVATVAASPAFAAPQNNGVVSSKVSDQQAQTAIEFWTPERMKKAKPLTPTLQGKPQSSGPSAESSPSGSPVKVNPASATPKATEAPSSTEAPQATATEDPIPLHATAVPQPYTDYPDRLNGKVFLVTPSGALGQCSATVVNSEGKSTVWTAGHCVHGGRGSQFFTNWVFVPAYSSSFNGHRPYGTWSARQLFTLTEWAVNSNARQDLGAVVVNRLNNQRIVDALGGQGIAFNQSRNQNFSAFGYPAESPFNSFLQWRCNSSRLGDDFPPGVGPATLRIHCNMTRGSSGGGWLINIGSNGLGFLNGLNSYRYGSTPDNLFGPYHANEALALYNAVRNQSA